MLIPGHQVTWNRFKFDPVRKKSKTEVKQFFFYNFITVNTMVVPLVFQIFEALNSNEFIELKLSIFFLGIS